MVPAEEAEGGVVVDEGFVAEGVEDAVLLESVADGDAEAGG